MDVQKPAQTSFSLWMNQNKDKFYKPGMTEADVTKAAGEEWRQMSDPEKAKWGKDKSEEDKERFAHEMAEQRGQEEEDGKEEEK